jgi:hypothetical protein
MTRSGGLFFVAVTALLAGRGQAATIFDSFEPGGSFHPQYNIVAAYGRTDDVGRSSATRFAVRFTVTDTSQLTSITMPISYQGDPPATLRVRLAENTGGYPGTTLEVLSENQSWPAFANPFTTKTTLTSVARPVLAAGASYWIVTELTSLPAGWADYRWSLTTSGPSVPILQQSSSDGTLPSDPWTGYSGSDSVPLLVEGDVLPGRDYYTLTPCRLVDSRVGLPGPLLAGETRSVPATTGNCGIPTGAGAVALNATVTQPTAPGNLRLFPAGLSVPLVSTLNYSAGQTRANNSIVALSDTGGFDVYCAQASGSTHFIVDVYGYLK